MELKSLIKSSGYYVVQAVYSPSPNGGQVLNSDDSLMLPIQRTHNNSKSMVSTTHVNALYKYTRPHDQRKRNRKKEATYICTLVRTVLNEPENWKELEENNDNNCNFLVFLMTYILFSTFIILLIRRACIKEVKQMQTPYGRISNCQKVN